MTISNRKLLKKQIMSGEIGAIGQVAFCNKALSRTPPKVFFHIFNILVNPFEFLALHKCPPLREALDAHSSRPVCCYKYEK